jgi:hypothetical protein
LRSSILAGALLLGACDGHIRVEGTAYELVNAGRAAPSEIVLDSSRAVPTGTLQPLAGVHVLLLHGADFRGRELTDITARPDGLFQEEDVSDQDGKFSMSAVTAPRKFHAAMRAEMAGYRTAYVTFLHERAAHHAVIVMVKEPD